MARALALRWRSFCPLQFFDPSQATNRTDEETSEKARVEVRSSCAPEVFGKRSDGSSKAMKPGANPWERHLTRGEAANLWRKGYQSDVLALHHREN